MRPVRFAYFRPDTIEAAVECLRDGDGTARILAGGQSLVPLLNRRLVRPGALVDLGQIAGLRYLACDEDMLRIGAMTTHADIEAASDPAVLAQFGVLPSSARHIGHLPVRTRGTFGGSIAHADPGAQWCLLSVLLDAQIVLHGPAGSRTVPAAAFFTGAHRTVAAPAEIVTEVRFPHRAPVAALAEFGFRAGHSPLVAAAAAVELGPLGMVLSARIALSGVADRPIRATAAEESLTGEILRPGLISQLARQVARGLRPPGDTPADARDRADLAEALMGRALQDCVLQDCALQNCASGRSTAGAFRTDTKRNGDGHDR
ncbi:MAG TPA: FAD binding domain-containing protein [Streptosporangiaceae bacterium]|nr:FAD binding domain-containing protein [Streptosporangiaceae bacterium]